MLHCVPARCEREVVGIVDGFCVEELRSVWKDDDAPDKDEVDIPIVPKDDE